MLCQCIIYIHTALKGSMFLKCCIRSLLVKVLEFQVPRIFCPENIELTAATPIYRCPNVEDLVHSTNYITMNSPISIQFAPLPHFPRKTKKFEKILNYITSFYMQPGVHNAINDMAKIKYLFVRN